MISIRNTLRTLNYRNYGIFRILGNAGFKPSAVLPSVLDVSTPRPCAALVKQHRTMISCADNLSTSL